MDNTIGIIIINIDGDILLTLPTGGKTYSFPKGLPEANETFIETAIREVLEETSLNLNIIQGEFSDNYYSQNYISGKKIVNLYLFHAKEDIKKYDLKCDSYFERDGKQIPENCKEFWCSLNDINTLDKIHEAQLKILKRVFNI